MDVSGNGVPIPLIHCIVIPCPKNSACLTAGHSDVPKIVRVNDYGNDHEIYPFMIHSRTRNYDNGLLSPRQKKGALALPLFFEPKKEREGI